VFLVARTNEELVHAVDAAAERGIPWRVIGSASNLLVSDEGLEGLVVRPASKSIASEPSPDREGQLIRADAGCLLAAVGKQLALQGLAGLEWAINVPGTVGASVVNNSGAFGSCTSEHLVAAEVHLPCVGIRVLDRDDLGLTYRTSRLKRSELAGVVLSTTFRTLAGDPAALRARITEIQRMRKATQPTGFSVGSVFANPVLAASGRLIEEAGLKGSCVGDAEVSTLHANFILNRGHARAADVLQLLQRIQRTVWERTGEWLLPEIQLTGRWQPEVLQSLYTPPAGHR
jgi:UDP-N-acetylmuramate dehydrogenase